MRHALFILKDIISMSKDEHPGRVSAVLNVWYLSVGVTLLCPLIDAHFLSVHLGMAAWWLELLRKQQAGSYIKPQIFFRKLICPIFQYLPLLMVLPIEQWCSSIQKYLFSLGFVLPLKWVCIYSCCMFICCSMHQMPHLFFLWHRINKIF